MDRHEMSKNELADVLGVWVARVRPYISHILIAIIVVVVGIILLVNRSRESRRQVDEAVLALPTALSAGGEFRAGSEAPKVLDRQIEALDSFLAKYPNSSVDALAQKALADRLYDRALLIWADPKGNVAKGDADLTRAKDIYSRLADRKDRIGTESQFGLACIAAEQGNKQEAETQLAALAKANPGTPVETMANQRLDVLLHSKPLKFGPEPKPAPPTPAPKTGAEAPKAGTEAPKPSVEAPRDGSAAPQHTPPAGEAAKPGAVQSPADKAVESPK
jgi:hypothetical protein